MRTLYPTIEPYAVHRIAVDGCNKLYLEESGNPVGLPVLFLHGGPGSGCSVEHRRFFDPERYRIILFDQRGSGRSFPLGGAEWNTASDLVGDMETIRRYLKLDRWLLFGGSWGATLALLYCESHPDRVLGMVLRGVFLAREKDLKWFFNDLRHLFPQQWEKFAQSVTEPEQSDLITAYYRRIYGSNEARSLNAAQAWSDWGSHVVHWNLIGEQSMQTEEGKDQTLLLAKARVETHYAQHRYFISDNQILERISLLPVMPVSIVHGSYDLTCTMEAAWLLHRAIPDSDLIVVPEAGHLAHEPAMVSALVTETDRMGDRFGHLIE